MQTAIADHANTILSKAFWGLTQLFSRNDTERYHVFQNFIFRALASLNQPSAQDFLLLCPAEVCVAKNEAHQAPAWRGRQRSPMQQRSRVSGEGCARSPGEGAQLSPDRRQLPATQPPSGTSAAFCLKLPMSPGPRCGTTTGRMLQPCPRAIQQMREEHRRNCAAELHKVSCEALLALA